jgi:uncharacterized protein
VPAATGGLLYELDPATGTVTPRPALGAKAHEGIRVDAQGNVYGISESNPGYIFKFTPDRRGDLSSGQLYALKIVQATGDRTGEAEWMAVDRSIVKVNANTAAAAVGATGYNRPEDLELATSTGNNRGGRTSCTSTSPTRRPTAAPWPSICRSRAATSSPSCTTTSRSA